MHDDDETTQQARKAKQSHDEIENAICQHIADIGIEGIVTGWTISASIAMMEGESEFDGMYTTQSNAMSKWQLIGLLVMALRGAQEDGYVID